MDLDETDLKKIWKEEILREFPLELILRQGKRCLWWSVPAQGVSMQTAFMTELLSAIDVCQLRNGSALEPMLVRQLCPTVLYCLCYLS